MLACASRVRLVLLVEQQPLELEPEFQRVLVPYEPKCLKQLVSCNNVIVMALFNCNIVRKELGKQDAQTLGTYVLQQQQQLQQQQRRCTDTAHVQTLRSSTRATSSRTRCSSTRAARISSSR